jgi:hypothetical protein
MKEKIKSLYSSKPLRISLYIIGVLFVLGFVFQLGTLIGYHRGNFGRDFGNHYERNLGFERGDSVRGMMRGNFPTAHGSFGKVLSVNFPNFVISDKDGTEKSILISDTTIIRSGLDNASSSIIKINDTVVVLGEPNTNGQIDAKLIRVMPNDFASSTGMFRMMFRK